MKVLSWIVHYKFIIVFLLFLSYLFFSENNILLHLTLKNEISALEQENELLEIKNNQMKLSNQEINENKDAMELYMREYYFLKKENEEIFRINYVEDKNEKKK
ncbi:MAG: septum formation initiator family protein [Bacteroidales bacterium]|nr:septum formation initiator family protein [Bacteroidales bacterium]MDD4209621.1 septum formation initiator family protein [Bacteroidales bacterium]